MAGLKAFSGKQVFDAVMLERGRLVAESVMRSDLALHQWAHECGVVLGQRPEEQGVTPRAQACRAGRSAQAALGVPALPRAFLRGVAKKTL
jgi:hypothetical protein